MTSLTLAGRSKIASHNLVAFLDRRYTFALRLSGKYVEKSQARTAICLMFVFTFSAVTAQPFPPASKDVYQTLSTDDRSSEAKLSDAVNVRDFGAIGDGLTDDAAAINAAIKHIRTRQVFDGEIAARLFFPQGRYLVKSTIDVTRIRSRNFEIDGAGAVILGNVVGKPVIDALGARYLRICNLSIEGDHANTPNIGIQIGRTDTTLNDSSDNISFMNVFVTGSFIFAAIYNLNAETSKFDRVNLWNDYRSVDSYSLVQDGLNHWKAKSDFVSENAPVDVPQSFNENLFINVDIRHFGGGVPIWMAQTSRHQFINSYVASTAGPHAVVLYSAAETDHNLMLQLDLHVETSAVTDAVLISGPNANPSLIGLQLRDHNNFSARSLFETDVGIRGVSLIAARLEIGEFNSPSARVFAQPELWSGTADVTVPNSLYWNGINQISAIVTAGKTKSLEWMGKVSVNALRVEPLSPMSSSSPCEVGQISADANFVYVCAAMNRWRRATLTDW